MRTHRLRGFTLIEMLVVLGVIGLLAAILIPAVMRARAAGRRTQCQSHLRQIGTALHNYHTSFKVFPSGSVANAGYSWGYIMLIAPHLELQNATNAVNFKNPDCGSEIKTLQAAGKPDPTSQLFPVLICPSDPSAGQSLVSGPTGPLPLSGDCGLLYPGNYLGVAGDQEGAACGGIVNGTGMLYTNSRTEMKSARDGHSMTMIVGERAMPSDLGWGWLFCGGTECEHYVSTERGLSRPTFTVSWTGNLRRFNSWHTGGAFFLFVDGAVHFRSDNIDLPTYKALSTRFGRELVSLE